MSTSTIPAPPATVSAPTTRAPFPTAARPTTTTATTTAATPTPTGSATDGAAPTGKDAPKHVVIVIFENKGAGQIIGTPAAPYLTSLAARGAVLTDAHGETHPSQPNYLALFSGSTHGLTDDSCPQDFTGDNLASELLAAGRTFAGYSEGLPEPGFTGCQAANYARKHNPWADFPALPASVNLPLTAMPTDFATLPTVAIVVPDLCHDMHNCSVATGDDWSRKHLDVFASWAATHNGLLIVTFDEGDGSDTTNHIPTFLVGSAVRPGASAQPANHYTLLRTITDMFGLASLGHAAEAQPLTGIWRGRT